MKLFAKFAFGLIPLLYVSNISAQEKIYKGIAHQWRLINDKHWQIVSDTPIAAPEKLINECPAGMIHVKGNMRLDPDPNIYGGKTIDALQKQACTKWLNKIPIYRDRCLKYDRDKWLKLSANLKTKPMDFCISKFEYPNFEGQYPMVMVSMLEAEQIAKSIGQRLCTEDEWTFSCESDEAMPYSYGYERDDAICTIDRSWRPYHSENFFPRDGVKLANELDYLWHGEKSGSRKKCKSVFGVYDQLGNVDEITVAKKFSPHKLALKGGYWGGPVRNRCRATTRSHDETFSFYQCGARFCQDIKQ